MTWLDAAILVVIALFGWLGTRSGLLIGFLELAGMVISVIIPLFTYLPASDLFVAMHVPEVYAGAVAFLVIWLIVTNLYFFAARRFYRRVPRGIRRSLVNRALGIIPGIARGLILAALFLAIVTSVPTPVVSDGVLNNSAIAQPIVGSTVAVSTCATNVFGEAVQTALGFLTVHPESDETVQMPFTVRNPTIDPRAEQEMLRLVNRERTSRGLAALKMDTKLQAVARAHSVDMFRRGYFAHNTLAGVTPFQRMKRGGVRFALAGENLAYARSVQMAHAGLMKSPGHRENILTRGFHRVGIGVAVSPRYGMMFTQDFRN